VSPKVSKLLPGYCRQMPKERVLYGVYRLFNDTSYLQFVPINPVNSVKTYTVACRRMLSSAPL
jgi:hypothetical protein